MENEENKRCAVCKKEVMSDWNWCPFCSSKITGQYTIELIIDQVMSKVIYCILQLKSTCKEPIGNDVLECLMDMRQSITQISEDIVREIRGE